MDEHPHHRSRRRCDRVRDRQGRREAVNPHRRVKRRAPSSQPARGSRFDSCLGTTYADFFDVIAPLRRLSRHNDFDGTSLRRRKLLGRVEKRASRLAHNQEIGGSNPSSATRRRNQQARRKARHVEPTRKREATLGRLRPLVVTTTSRTVQVVMEAHRTGAHSQTPGLPGSQVRSLP